jgi:putative DNA primase/helicase
LGVPQEDFIMAAAASQVKPSLLIPENIPSELRDYPHWVGWRFVQRPDRPKPDKVPVNPRTGAWAKPNDPRTWAPFHDALDVYERRRLDGVGFMFTKEGPHTGIDLDACRDPHSGRLDPWAEEIAAAIKSYADISPSDTGAKIILRGKLPADAGHCYKQAGGGRVELYDAGRFFTLTGRLLDGYPATIQPAQEALDRLCGFLGRRPERPRPDRPSPKVLLPSDDELVSMAAAAANGAKFTRLWSGDWSGYSTHSHADLALVQLLAFWTGGDADRIDALFRQSGLMRGKWDERRGSETYGQRTIRRAVGTSLAFYSGKPAPPASPERDCVIKSVSKPRRTREDQDELILAYVRSARLRYGRPVGLSARQTADLIGKSPATGARRRVDLVEDGRLILVSEGTYGNGLASEYDLPEFVPAAAEATTPSKQTDGRARARPDGPPPYTYTAGGAIAVWRWSFRRGEWMHYGDCPDAEAANALVRRRMSRRSGTWSVGGECRTYVRGRGQRVTKWT